MTKPLRNPHRASFDGKPQTRILPLKEARPGQVITYRDGIYGLIANAESLAVIGGVLYGALRGLRRWRGIKEPSGDSNRDRQDT